MSAQLEFSSYVVRDVITFRIWLLVAGSVPIFFVTCSEKSPTAMREITNIICDFKRVLYEIIKLSVFFAMYSMCDPTRLLSGDNLGIFHQDKELNP